MVERQGEAARGQYHQGVSAVPAAHSSRVRHPRQDSQFDSDRQIKQKDFVFLIDRKNTFYLDFGLGLLEEFPTIIEYDMDTDQYKRVFFE